MSHEQVKWSIETDVIVVVAGGAGLVSAINAHDHGARVRIFEKVKNVGGTTILAGGGIKAANDVKKVTQYLTKTQGGRVSDDLIKVFAQGLVDLEKYLRELAKVNQAEVTVRTDTHGGIYPFPGADSLYSLQVTNIPGFEGYPWTYTGKNLNGQRFFKVLLDNVEQRHIPITTNAAVQSLITNGDGRIIGVWVNIDGQLQAVRALGGVILASGGFEFNEKLKKEYFDAIPIYSMGNPGNTGDGILMAQKVGASLWHMWHFHGSYGFKFPEYDNAFRIAPGGARNDERPVSWILVDKFGKRFTNELHPAVQDTAARPLAHFDPDIPDYTRIPAYLIFDEPGRQLDRIANPLTSYDNHRYIWSEDNSAEVERGWIKKYNTIEELATAQGWSVEVTEATIARWNQQVAAGKDEDFKRPAGTIVPISQAPYYVVPVWPILTNTQGGPEHDADQRVLDPYGQAIPGLYAVGELGSFFAHLYLLGGNLSEVVISGRQAGKAAALEVKRQTERNSSAAKTA